MSGRTLRWLMSLARPTSTTLDGGAARLTIIRHHRVYGGDERPLYRLGVTERLFVEQLEMLVAAGLTPITAAEGWRRVREGRPGHWVAMTFDDGYADNVERALPHLRAASAAATFYLTAGLIEERRAPWWDVLGHALERTAERRLTWSVEGRTLDLPLGSHVERVRALLEVVPLLARPTEERDRRLAALRERLGVAEAAPCELMTWDQAAGLARSGMELGGHTLRHPRLALLPAEAQRAEIVGSLDLIERRTGVRPVGFAYPEGDHDERTLAIVAEAGLEYAVVTRAGTVDAAAPRYALRRRGLSEGACLDPAGRFSRRLAMAELEGAFDRLRDVGAPS